ncbi:NUDIX hydrolase [Neorhizobium sp. BT27B]|uniref:NUDIX hydrolase n=1 Tax=Neorhizobium sp. BT27B TaxID=3142625 RepID=UPI003D2ADAA7
MKSDTKFPSGKSTSADVIEQAGALCLRILPNGETEILLVGSRRNGRWGLPKGHIDQDEASHLAAAREAFEEAGIRGEISDTIAGSFVYTKDSSPARYRVIVHRLTVTSMEDAYPEQGMRNRQWFTLAEAGRVAGHEGLRDLLRDLS